MIDLTKHVLPQCVEVDGSLYPIKTDFCYWVRFNQLIKDKGATVFDFDFLYTGKKPADRLHGLQALLDFANPRELLPNDRNNAVDIDESDIEADGMEEQALDYTIDGSRIYAAFLQCYHIDLIDTPLHWYKFLALLSCLKNTLLNDVISYRLWEKPNEHEKDAYNRTMQELKESWALPLSEAEKEAVDKFNAQFD